jgi:hypothetical protein
VKRTTWISIGIAAAVLCLATASPVSACPMCKLAAESAARQPRAYMYSILFMMSMPMMLTTGFGIAFWRLNREANRLREEQLQAQTQPEQPTLENDAN